MTFKKNQIMANILIVDDNPDNLLALESLIKAPDRNILRASSGNEALELLLIHQFALALIDVQMPGMNGFELAEIMRASSFTLSVPIVFVTAAAYNENFKFKGYESGGVDVLFKPLDSFIVKSKVNVFVELFFQREEIRLAKENEKMLVERYERALSASQTGTWEWNILTNEVLFSSVAKNIFNLTGDHFRTGHFFSRVHPDDRQKLQENLENCVKEKKDYEAEFRIIKPDGTVAWLAGRGSAYYNPVTKKPERMFGINIDITKTKVLEKKLKTTQEKLDFALEAANVGVWEIDLKAKLVHCSGKFEELFGFKDSMKSRPFRDFDKIIHPDDLNVVQAKIKNSLEKSSSYEAEFRVILSDGSVRWLLSKGKPFNDPHEKPERVVGITVDISKFKYYEEELKSVIRTRDEFMSIASHELRTPLTSLTLQLQMLDRMLLKGKSDLEVRQQKIADLAIKQTKRLSSLIDELMDLTRIRLGILQLKRNPTDLLHLVREMIERLKMDADKKGVQVHFHGDNSVLGMWDSVRLEQVIINLLSNALKYGDGKPIDVDIYSDQDKKKVFLKVADKGLGIPDDMQNKIFERFERAFGGSEIIGLGLGLYISKQIVEAHEGRITVESQIGKGSVFTVELPLNPAT